MKQRNTSYAFRQIRKAMLDDPDAACIDCGSTEQLEIDHVLPVAAGGTDDRSNLVVRCKTHNLLKGAKVGPIRTTWFNPRWLNRI